MQTKDMEETWQQLALEVTVTLAENASAMVRKLAGDTVVFIIVHVLEMMTLIDEEEDWSQADEVVEDDSSR